MGEPHHYSVPYEPREPQRGAVPEDTPLDAEVAAFVEALITEIVQQVPQLMVQRFKHPEDA